MGKRQAGGGRQYKHISEELSHQNQLTSHVHQIHCIDDGGRAGTHSKYCNIDHAIPHRRERRKCIVTNLGPSGDGRPASPPRGMRPNQAHGRSTMFHRRWRRLTTTTPTLSVRFKLPHSIFYCTCTGYRLLLVQDSVAGRIVAGSLPPEDGGAGASRQYCVAGNDPPHNIIHLLLTK